MAKTNFAAVMAEIFAHEGGLSMTRKDPGNWTGGKVGAGDLRGTKYGIAAHAHPGLDIAGLTKAQAQAIYAQKYWRPIRGDDLPEGLDLVTMDPAVNSGPARGVRWLQQGLGVGRDGRMGPLTLVAARAADPVAVITAATAARMGFLRGLAVWGAFGAGWAARVSRVEAVSVRMATEAAGAPARPVLIAEKAKSTAAARRDSAGAGTTAAGGGGGISLADLPDWALAVAAVVVVVVIVNFIGRARVSRARAAEFQTVAEEARK